MDLSAEEIAQIQKMHDLVNDRDFYQLLNVSQNSSLDDIKKSYYATSRKWHPDRFFRKNTGSYSKMLEKIFIGINQAFKILTTAEEKILFDKQYVSNVQTETRSNTGGKTTFARHRRKRAQPRKKQNERKKHTGKKDQILSPIHADLFHPARGLQLAIWI